MNKNNPYGYKVCYRENGCKDFIRHFLTYTYNQALQARRYYRKYETKSRDDNHLLKKTVLDNNPDQKVRSQRWHLA